MRINQTVLSIMPLTPLLIACQQPTTHDAPSRHMNPVPQRAETSQHLVRFEEQLALLEKKTLNRAASHDNDDAGSARNPSIDGRVLRDVEEIHGQWQFIREIIDARMATLDRHVDKSRNR